MQDIKILGISGKKQSGKSSTANYILGIFLQALEICSQTKITPSGLLWVSDIFGNTQHQGILDLNYDSLATREFVKEHIYPFVKIYSFADLLKRKVCIDVLGLTYEQCYGTDQQKNTLTHIKWKDLPTIPNDSPLDANEYLIARQIMQYVGTDLFRKMYTNVWVDSTLRQIKKDDSSMAIIADVRFPNEVEGIQRENGKVLRLTRNPFEGKDQHSSETKLDDYDGFDGIIDNQNMNIFEKNDAVRAWLDSVKWLPHNVPVHMIRSLVQ